MDLRSAVGKSAAEVIAREGWEPHIRVGFPFKVERQNGNNERIIDGTASVDGFMDDGILLDPDGFPEAITDYMEFGLLQSGHRLLPEFTLGRALRAEYLSGVGFNLRAMVSQAPDVESTWIKIEEEILRAYSVGFFILDGYFDPGMDGFRATRFAIPEVSVVPMPRDRGALFSVSRSFQPIVDRKGRGARDALLELLGKVKTDSKPEPKQRITLDGHGLDEDILAASVAASTQRHLANASLLRTLVQRAQF